jgi:hypothetical protein
MPCTPEHRKATRGRILASAWGFFNRDGPAGCLLQLFNNMEELYAEAITLFSRRFPAEPWQCPYPGPPAEGANLARMIVSAFGSGCASSPGNRWGVDQHRRPQWAVAVVAERRKPKPIHCGHRPSDPSAPEAMDGSTLRCSHDRASDAPIRQKCCWGRPPRSRTPNWLNGFLNSLDSGSL